MAFINLSRKYAFLATARTASTSCYYELEKISIHNNEKYISHKGESPDLYHIGLKEFLYNYPQFRDFYIFSTVRDPYTRLISSWNEFSRFDKHFGWADGIKICSNISDFLMTFDKNISRMSVHFRPQFLQLNYLNRRSVDKIMYYEKLHDDFSEITKILYGKSYYLKNKSRVSPKINYSEVIKKRLKECVYKNYLLDIQNYYKSHIRYS